MQTELREKDDVALIANFTFVARDWRTQKAAPVNHLVPQTEEEKQLFAMGAARDAHRKKLRMGNQLSSTSPLAKEYNDRLTQILREVCLISTHPNHVCITIFTVNMLGYGLQRKPQFSYALVGIIGTGAV